ncbi:hypothetical protein M885DRAFT_563161 [Pelagophyceae sp. CCMP2097]|nr:hypothetical protein M885DRAFT_563161 [Pelagophyceae sp. CCMP2097]
MRNRGTRFVVEDDRGGEAFVSPFPAAAAFLANVAEVKKYAQPLFAISGGREFLVGRLSLMQDYTDGVDPSVCRITRVTACGGERVDRIFARDAATIVGLLWHPPRILQRPTPQPVTPL